MNIELTMLASSIVLGLIQLGMATFAALKAYGLKWAAGPRDEAPADELGPFADRLVRVQRNFMETFPFFAAAALMAVFLHNDSLLATLGCQLYFWARLAYVPVYAFGLPYVRTLVWGVSVAGILMLVAASFPI